MEIEITFLPWALAFSWAVRTASTWPLGALVASSAGRLRAFLASWPWASSLLNDMCLGQFRQFTSSLTPDIIPDPKKGSLVMSGANKIEAIKLARPFLYIFVVSRKSLIPRERFEVVIWTLAFNPRRLGANHYQRTRGRDLMVVVRFSIVFLVKQLVFSQLVGFKPTKNVIETSFLLEPWIMKDDNYPPGN